MKACRTCGEEKDLSAFYKGERMLDGRLNICKDCTKARVAEHRAENLERIQDYDRERSRLPHRRERLIALGQKQIENGNKHAVNLLNSAVKCGRKTRPDHCSECSKSCKPEGHHDDYSKPLDVRWVCRSCHAKIHAGVLV